MGNSLGVNRAHALLIEGEMGSEAPASLRMTALCVPYDVARAVQLAEESSDMPNRQQYITEITTAVYAR